MDGNRGDLFCSSCYSVSFISNFLTNRGCINSQQRSFMNLIYNNKAEGLKNLKKNNKELANGFKDATETSNATEKT